LLTINHSKTHFAPTLKEDEFWNDFINNLNIFHETK